MNDWFCDLDVLPPKKTAMIRRRINSLSAIMNYAYSELDLDKRNPFTRLFIRNEGDDVFKRGTFSRDQLKQGCCQTKSNTSQSTKITQIYEAQI
jgi:hypothetical protein